MATRWQEENPHERFRIETLCPFCGQPTVAFWYDPGAGLGDTDPFQARCGSCDARGPVGHAGEGDALLGWFGAVPAGVDVAVTRLRVERPAGFSLDGKAPHPPPSYEELVEALRSCAAALGTDHPDGTRAGRLSDRVPAIPRVGRDPSNG